MRASKVRDMTNGIATCQPCNIAGTHFNLNPPCIRPADQ